MISTLMIDDKVGVNYLTLLRGPKLFSDIISEVTEVRMLLLAWLLSIFDPPAGVFAAPAAPSVRLFIRMKDRLRCMLGYKQTYT